MTQRRLTTATQEPITGPHFLGVVQAAGGGGPEGADRFPDQLVDSPVGRTERGDSLHW